MKEIILNKGFVAYVDDEDYDLVLSTPSGEKEAKWFIRFPSKYNCTPYVVKKIRSQIQKDFYSQIMNTPITTYQLSIHRLILKCGPNDIVDHIDGNGLNNQRKNLRICTPQQNSHNTRLRTDNTSGYKGVRRDPRIKEGSRCWVANIREPTAKKNITIGYYHSKEEAALAYNEMASKLFGDYAYLNNLNSLFEYNYSLL